jgi:glucose/mannose-6-phosphate isomerase
MTEKEWSVGGLVLSSVSPPGGRKRYDATTARRRMPDRRDEGLTTMRSLATRLPIQLADGFRAGEELGAAVPRATQGAFLTGMGGSAIAGDLARILIDPETELRLSVVRSPELPLAVGPHTVTILASYSGNTWETLAAYTEAGRRGARRIAMSSGGELAHRAEQDGVPFLQLPPGMPPRCAVGYMLGSLLGLCDRFFPESNDARIRRASRHVQELQRSLLSTRGVAARLATRVGARIPFVFTETGFGPLARRWKTQIEENAKRIATYDEVPELWHNAIVGWDAMPPRPSLAIAVLMLEWSGASAMTQKGLRYFERLLRNRKVLVAAVPLVPEDRLEALLSGISIGDHFSLFLAEQAHVDPYGIEAIARLRKTMEAA